MVLAQVTPSMFFSRIQVRSDALVYNLYQFFRTQPFYGNYSTLGLSTVKCISLHLLKLSSDKTNFFKTWPLACFRLARSPAPGQSGVQRPRQKSRGLGVLVGTVG